MARTTQVRRVVGNPGKKYRRANPGDIIGFTLAAGNPGKKKGGTMAAAKKAHKKGSGYSASKYKKSKAKGNPGHKGGHVHKAKYRRVHNPGMGSMGPLVTNAAFVIVGALGSKLGAQAILGTKNTGILGYAGNAGVGFLLWFLTEKVMKNRAASSGVIAGTLVQILLRVINDYTPFGQYVAQLGMGDYQMQSFVTPQVLTDPWNSASVQIPNGWGGGMLPAAAPPPAATAAGGAGPGMAGLYGGTEWGGSRLY